MQRISNGFECSLRSYPTRVWVAMLLALTFCLGATVATAANKPAVVVSQVKFLADTTGGGFTAGGTPLGGSFAVTQQGDIVVGTTYGGKIDYFNGSTGTVTSFGESGPAGIAVDSHNNLYAGAQYAKQVFKFPYVSGAYVTGATYSNCTGNDTERCLLPSLSGDSMPNFRALVFDAAGNLFAVNVTDGTNGGNKIYEVAAADLYTAGSAKVVYTADSTHAIGSIAIDPWGNLFFTDAVYSTQSDGTATNSNLKVLPYSASTGYAADATLLVSYTNASPGQYDNVLGGVSVDPATGTVYYSDTNTGTFAFANTPSNFADVAHAYMVSNKGNYQTAPDGKGNLWTVAYDNAAGKAAVYHILLNNVSVPTSAVAAASSATDITTVLNGVDCSGSVAFALAGGNTTVASAGTTGTCSTVSFGDAPNTVAGAVFATTVSLTPAVAGTSVAVMKATDSASNVGNFTITGGEVVGRQSIVVSQTSLLGDLTAGSFNAGKMPSGGSFAVTPNGYIVVGTSYGNDVDVLNLSTGAETKFTLSNNAGFISDSQSNLFGDLLYSHTFYKFPYVGGTWAVDTTNAAACTGSDTVACKMPNLTSGDYNANLDFKNSAFDTAGNLFLVTATDNQNGGNAIYELSAAKLYSGPPVLVFTDDATHVIASIAVDPWGNLFFTDATYSTQSDQTSTSSSLNVLPYSASAGFALSKTVLTTYTNDAPGQYDNVLSGVAVDGNGAVYYSDNGHTFAIPNHPSIPLNIANAYMVSTTGGYQIMPDGKGNLYSVAYDNVGGKQGVFNVLVNNVVIPKTTAGVASEATNVFTALNSVDCSGSVTFAADSGNASAASAAVPNGATCTTSTLAGASGAVLPITVSVTPAAAGTNVVTLIATDSANNTGSFTATVFANAGTEPQTISFENPGTQKVGTTLTLTATTTAPNLTVTLTSTTTSVCKVSGATATFVGAGTCIIEATQPGNEVYAAAQKVTQSFTVELVPQTITFANPGTRKMGTTLSLSATSDSSLAVSFDSSTTDVCTVSGTTASFIAAGTCTINANQAGNTTYAAAPPVSQSFTVNGPVPTPTFSPTAGAYTTAQTVSIADALPGAVIYYTTDGSAPSASSTQYTGPISIPVTTTINAIAVAENYPDSAIASAAFTITQDFTFTIAPSTITVQSGGSGTAKLTVNRVGGYSDPIWFACSGLPAGYTCSFSPAAIMSTTTTDSTTITITKPASPWAFVSHSSRSLFASIVFVVPLCLLGLRRNRRLQLALLVVLGLASLVMLAGCGGGGKSTTTTQASTARVTVTATSGIIQHTTTVTLTVQ